MPWLIVLLLLASPLATAADAGQLSRVEVQQKLQLLKMLLAGSSSASSHSTELATLNAKASDAFANGNLTVADTLADEALSAIENAKRLSSGTSKVELTRYADMLEDIQSLEATYLNAYKTLPAAEKQTYDTLIGRAPPLIAQAQALTRDRHYSKAIEHLETVHEIYVAAINKMVADTAVVYDNEFDSPVEEFDYELVRYQGYEELTPLAKAQFQPNKGILQLSERYIADSREIRDQAKQQAASDKYQFAIQTMQNATKRLQTALRAIGLVVPE